MKKILLLLSIVFSSLFVGAQSTADVSELGKYKVLFTVSFIRYIDFDDAGSAKDFVIGVYKSDDLANRFEKTVGDKEVRLRPVKINKFNKLDQITHCDIIYVASPYISKKNFDIIKNKVGDKCLIVTENLKMYEGSMFNFIIADSKLKFEVDLAAIEKGGLKVASNLVSMSNAIVK